MIVVSDTSPINYMCQIGHTEILRLLFERVILPSGVADELQRPTAAQLVRQFISGPPDWLAIRVPEAIGASLAELGTGEREAISLAQELRADLLLMDDKRARQAAFRRNVRVIGTLGVLKLAADRGLLDLRTAIHHLEATQSYLSEGVLRELMKSVHKTPEQR